MRLTTLQPQAKQDIKENISFNRSPGNWMEWVIVVCNILDESQEYRFQVSGFGQTSWPVDIRTDFATVLEQMPDLMTKLVHASGDFSLDFYEQGIERELKFLWKDTEATIDCVSRTAWNPSPSRISSTTIAVRKTFRTITNDFCASIQQTLPMFVGSPYYQMLIQHVEKLDADPVSIER